MPNVPPEKGKLLIAEPSLTGDISFNRSVLILAEHNSRGSVAFILNKPLEFSVHQLIEEINIPMKVFNGGPVEQDNLYFIHSIPYLINNSIEIADGIFWGGDFENVVSLINEGKITEDDIRFFLGYSGWSSKQFESELASKSWILVENEYKNDIIKASKTTLWKEKMQELGGDYLVWSNAPENPELN